MGGRGRGGGRPPYPRGSLSRLAVELAIATRTDPAVWLAADTATINTALEVLEEKANR